MHPKVGLHLISGPEKSGKSIWAESLMSNLENVCYIATSKNCYQDKDWNNKIIIHKSRRPKHWNLIESNGDLPKEIINAGDSNGMLVDSIGGFISWHLNLSDDKWNVIVNRLENAISSYKGVLLIVSEEIGWDVVPATKEGYLFRKRMGNLVRCLQSYSICFWLVIHNRALNLNEIGHEVI